MQLLEIFRKSPFARLLFFYAAGIISAEACCIHSKLFCFLLTGTGALFIAVLVVTVCRKPGYNTGWISGLISGIILFMAGLMNMNIHYQEGILLLKTSGDQGPFVMEISDPPEVKGKIVKATANIKNCLVEGVWNKDRQKIMVYIEKDSLSVKLLPGDRLLVKSTLRSITPPGNPGEFDYRKYLATKSIYNQAYLASGLWKAIGHNDKISIRLLAFHMQEQLLHAYQKIGLNSTCYSLLSALTIGYKNDLETHTKQVFSQAGVMHVMALSGFNVAVIALAMGYLLFFSDRFRSGRLLKTVLIVLATWLFAFVTGLSPSVTRATVMISFVMAGKLIHRQINTYNILFASAFFLLTISPALISDISFQLSFAAVLGIVVYQPVFYRILVLKNFFADKIWQLFTVSCAAQLSTLPLTLYYFHQFPVYFWLTNLYVVPLVSVIICMAGVFLLVSSIDPLMLLTGKMLAILTGILYKAVAFTKILPFSLIENIHISGLQVVILVAFFFFLAVFFIKRKIGPLWLALSLFVIFQGMNTLHELRLRNQKVILVGDLKGISVLHVISGRSGLLLGDSALIHEDQAMQYAFQKFWIEHGVADHIRMCKYENLFLHDDNIFIEFSGKRIAYLKDNSLYRFRVFCPLKVDVAIITGTMKPDLDGLLRLLDTELLILDSSVKKYQALQWIKACQRLGVNYWNVSQRGAYLHTIR